MKTTTQLGRNGETHSVSELNPHANDFQVHNSLILGNYNKNPNL